MSIETWAAKNALVLGLIAAAVLAIGGILGFAKFKAWYYQGKSERLEAKLEVSQAETKVARQDEAQGARSATAAATTVAAQDTHADAHRAGTTQATEVIRERIREVPVVVPAADDLLVRAEVDKARARAQAAQDRVRGTPSH